MRLRRIRSRRALLVLLPLILAALPPALARAQDPSPTPTPSPSATPRECVPNAPDGYQQVVNLTFPVRGPVHYGDDYDQPRSGGRTHQATDLMADKLQTVHAALGGEVVVATGIDEPMPSYGYYLKIRHDNGLESAYVHLNNDTPDTDDGQGGPQWAYAPGIRKGVRVERGQWIGYLGDSGNAEQTAPHLHFELSNPAWAAQSEGDMPWDPCLDDDKYKTKTRYNPYPSLKDAQARNDLPPPPPVAQVTRVAGATRVLTAAAIAQRFDAAARAVIVVPEGTHAEALSAASLAGLLDSPVLLSSASGLHPDVVAQVQRLRPRNAYLIGRGEQLSEQVAAQLTDAGVSNLARLAEDDVFALSARLAREVRSYAEAPSLERVLLVLGEHNDPARAWPDALSAGALAALSKAPVLFTRGEALPEAVRQVLAELRPPLVQVIGGPGAISDAVAGQAAAAAGGSWQRLSGANRYATSVAVADEAVRLGLSAPRVWLATGHAFPDALAAGPAAAREGAPLLLIDGRTPGGAPEPEQWLAGRAAQIDDGVAVGGQAAISEDVRARLARLLATP